MSTTPLIKKVLLSLAFVLATSSCRSGRQSEEAPSDERHRELDAIDQELETIRREFRARDTLSVADELAHMVELDTFVRTQLLVVVDSAKRAVVGAQVREVDRRNTKRIKELLQQRGWFRISRFGREADTNAWLVVQHADHDRAFQKKTLELLTLLMEEGETDPANYAYLSDRVAIADGEPQRYGTQGSCVGVSWVEARLEEPNEIDNHRFSVGLGTLEEYRRIAAANCR